MVCSNSLCKEFCLVEAISPIPVGISMGLMDFESLIYRPEYTFVVVHLNQASGSQECP